MKQLLTASVFLALTLGTVLSQTANDGLVMRGGDPVDRYRYRGVDDSPFFMESVLVANMMRNDGVMVQGVSMRFNGYTQEFEVPQGDEFVELDKSWYLRVEIRPEDNPHLADQLPADGLILQRGLHSRFNDRFVILMFAGNDLYLIKEFIVDMKEVSVQDVGKQRDFKRFNAKAFYYIKEHGKVRLVKLKKKSVIEEINLPEVESFIRTEKLKCNTEEDLLTIVEYYNTLKIQNP